MRTSIPAGFPCLLCLPCFFTSCADLEPFPPGDHVVAAPISKRANEVLRNLILEYGSSEGRWLRCMSPGCTQIWATQFGYRAGIRRDRDDLLELAQVTAGRVSSEFRGLAWDALFGNYDRNNPAIFSFPALFISGAMDQGKVDRILIAQVMKRMDQVGREGHLGYLESTGLAMLLAAAAQLQPHRREEHLEKARKFAEGASGGGFLPLACLARAAIARVSRDEGDIDSARRAIQSTSYRFDERTGALLPPKPEDEILSLHLAMVHALADMAQVTGDPVYHARAMSLLNYVFSDAYFNGKFLAHDLVRGKSDAVCSGCNFMALYLVDRLFGDSFVIDPVPPLPEREFPGEGNGPPGQWDLRITLKKGTPAEPGMAGGKVGPLGRSGSAAFVHETGDAWTTVAFEVQPSHGIYPHGAISIEIQFHTSGESKNTLIAGFGSDGHARFAPLGKEPLVIYLDFERTEDGSLWGHYRCMEKKPD